jgi:membrane associated rhomboid family serine protease
MGIYDRDYVGADRPARAPRGFGGGFGGRPGLGPPRLWSGNAWIIALCISVFVLDGLLYAGFNAAIRVDMGSAYVEGVTDAQKERAVVQRSGERMIASRSMRGSAADPIVDPQTNQVIGEMRYQIMPPLLGLGHFSTGKGFLGLEVWRLVTFQFLHANMTHLLFNMLGLFFFGSIVEQYLGKRLYLAFYLVCGIFGAVMYLLLNLLGQAATFPGVLVGDIYTPLIGASAGVFGVLMAAARLSPNTTVLFMFFIPMRLSTLIYLLVGIAAFTLVTSGANAGGEAAHLGGAIAGWFFINNAHLLSDFFEVLGPPGARSRGKAPKPGRPKRRRKQAPKQDEDAEVDRILAKVANQGLESLTAKERKYLNKVSASKRD